METIRAGGFVIAHREQGTSNLVMAHNRSETLQILLYDRGKEEMVCRLLVIGETEEKRALKLVTIAFKIL